MAYNNTAIFSINQVCFVLKAAGPVEMIMPLAGRVYPAFYTYIPLDENAHRNKAGGKNGRPLKRTRYRRIYQLTRHAR
jgi:hypothetical protein